MKDVVRILFDTALLGTTISVVVILVWSIFNGGQVTIFTNKYNEMYFETALITSIAIGQTWRIVREIKDYASK